MERQNQGNPLQMETLDTEWVELLSIARALGISKETVKDFLNSIPGQRANNSKSSSSDSLPSYTRYP